MKKFHNNGDILPNTLQRKQSQLTLTPLHVAFAWVFKTRFRKLSFAALTIGAMIPDLEPLVGWMLGLSVFCGWDFPCSLEPDRLVLHSLFGAVTIDAALAILFVKLAGLLKLERVGIHGFSKSRISVNLYASAAVGSVSHVLVDWLHHPANPVFWPVLIDGSYYVGGLLLPFVSVFTASFVLAIVSAGMIAAMTKLALNRAGYSFWLALTNPPKTVSIVTQYLSKS